MITSLKCCPCSLDAFLKPKPYVQPLAVYKIGPGSVAYPEGVLGGFSTSYFCLLFENWKKLHHLSNNIFLYQTISPTTQQRAAGRPLRGAKAKRSSPSHSSRRPIRFLQSFTRSFFVHKCFFTHLLFICFLLGLVIFGERKLAQKLLIKCWWNWLYIGVNFTNTLYAAFGTFSLCLYFFGTWILANKLRL